MSTRRIVRLAERLVNGECAKIPAMKATDWDQLRWWIDYLKGYAL